MAAKRFVRVILVLCFWLFVWAVAYFLVAKEILIASPWATFGRLLVLARETAFWQTVCTTLGRILAGYLLGVVVGCLLAVITACLAFARALLLPVLNVVKATPVASFILLALLWLHTGLVPAFISFLIVLPLVWSNLDEGLRRVDPELLEMGRSFRFSRGKLLLGIYLPSLLPYFMAAATTGMGLAWKSGVAAEVIATPGRAIGSSLYEAKIYLETVDLFAWTVMVVLLSLVLEKLLTMLVQRLSRRFHLSQDKGRKEE